MTDKELVRRLFSKGVRRELKTLLLQQDSGKRSKNSDQDAQSDSKKGSKKQRRDNKKKN